MARWRPRPAPEVVGCVITTGGVGLNDEEKHQIGFSGLVRAATDTRSRADAAPMAYMHPSRKYRSRRSLVIWEMSDDGVL